MDAAVADLLVALDAIGTLPAAQAELARQIDGDADYPPDAAGGLTLMAARLRLRELPLPQGEHPFLDEIVDALDAAEAALPALASVEGGDAAFAAAEARAS